MIDDLHTQNEYLKNTIDILLLSDDDSLVYSSEIHSYNSQSKARIRLKSLFITLVH